MDRGSEEGLLSVGKALENNVAFSVNHPLYQSLSDVMEKKVAEYSAQKGLAKSTSAVALVTVGLSAEELTVVARLFPEMRLTVFPFSKPAHSLFWQFRRLSLEWCVLQVRKLAISVVVMGSPVVSVLQGGFESASFFVDSASPVAVHERHSAALDAYRLYANSHEVAKEVDSRFDRSEYDEFLRGRKYQVHTDFNALPDADAMCVDGYLAALGPGQVAASMLAVDASVAVGFFPYHPVMLMDTEGEIPGYGVHFQRTEEELRILYPEGLSGVSSYPLDVWRAWLCGHTFSLGVENPVWFQLELLKNRGCCMFYRMVRLPAPPVHQEVIHALDLPTDEPMYVVSSHRLTSLVDDPKLEKNWRTSNYCYGQRMVDRVYQFAMQLPREQFTRYAIRKQIHVVNDRVTVEGTSVKVNSALGTKMVDALVVDIFARAFVDRYDAGTLVEAAKSYVDAGAGFHKMTYGEKLWFITTTCAMAVWEVTLSPLNRYVRCAADAVRDKLSALPTLRAPVIRPTPSYVLLGAGSQHLKEFGASLSVGELDRRAAVGSQGLLSELVRSLAQLAGPERKLDTSVFRVSNVPLFGASPAPKSEVDEVVGLMRGLNPVDEAPYFRRSLEAESATRALASDIPVHFNPDASPAITLNEFYSTVLPGVAEQELEFDTASISLDPQDRTLAAPYLRLPKYFGDVPKSRTYYRSKLRALNVPKRQNTLQELLSAVAARNLNAPQVSLPQDDAATARVVWENFLDVACIPEARQLLQGFKSDWVGLEEDAFREWVEQSTPEKLQAVKRELQEESEALAQMDVSDYLVMLKADVKPTLSRKPLDQRTEPQVIVYHKKALSALYSSIFRVLVRRFLALLKPNYHVNLLKDTKDMEAFVRGVHPYSTGKLKYLENDFSKYDKSQGRFVFILEELVFQELGMNRDFLRHWTAGHVECNLRAVGMGLSLHVMYQRKSGDATTAFGNVLLNVLSVSYAYRGTEVLWALFMGDDSLVCARAVAHSDDAVTILSEVFNLGAKTYLTDAPYFASNFVLIDDINRDVHLVPDPVKRVERWSMSISGDDPQWHERYISARDSMRVYLSCAKTVLLPKLIAERYDVKSGAASGVADAIATIVSSEKEFRKLWEDEPTLSMY